MPEFADWVRAFAMMGTDGTDYLPVLLGPDGSMYSVLQGEYEGALRTVKLDDEGRMSAFVIDSVDAWGRMLSVGNAELAARLGSSVVYEQGGRVQFLESFEYGLGRWTVTVSGAASEAVSSPVAFLSGGYSAKLTSDGTMLRYAQIEHEQGNLPLGKVGIAFAFSSETDFEYLSMSVRPYDGEHYYTISLKLNSATDTVDIFTTTGWESVMDFDPASSDIRKFYMCKITVNLAEQLYDTLRCNQETVNISAHAVTAVVDDEVPHVKFTSILQGRNAVVDTAYLDDIIYTTSEP